MIGWLIALAVIGFITWYIYKTFYFINIDHTLMFTGAPGTGKTNEGVKWSLKLWRIIRRNIRMHNWFQRFKKKAKRSYEVLPYLYSNIPIRIGRYNKKQYQSIVENLLKAGIAQDYIDKNVSHDKFCEPLTVLHLLGQQKLCKKAVVFVTELGQVASQYSWPNLNVQEHLDDFIGFYRQYTLGGYFLCDSQSSDLICKQIRTRIGTVVNMLHFKKFWKIYLVRMRLLNISEEIKTNDDASAEDSMKWHIGMFPLFHRNYDTYSFSGRYSTVPAAPRFIFLAYKTNEILDLPEVKITKYAGQELIEGLLPSQLKTKNDVSVQLTK